MDFACQANGVLGSHSRHCHVNQHGRDGVRILEQQLDGSAATTDQHGGVTKILEQRTSKGSNGWIVIDNEYFQLTTTLGRH
jgi:hypothetical protein